MREERLKDRKKIDLKNNSHACQKNILSKNFLNIHKNDALPKKLKGIHALALVKRKYLIYLFSSRVERSFRVGRPETPFQQYFTIYEFIDAIFDSGCRPKAMIHFAKHVRMHKLP